MIGRVKLIVGLGNPGFSYRGTRHNAGAQAVEKLAKKHKFLFKPSRSFKSLIASGKIQGQPVCLALPQTFMNLSGEAVLALVSALGGSLPVRQAGKKKGIAAGDILIVYDDTALKLGDIKIKTKGSDGGHHGLASVIEKLNTRDIPRLRLGIGRGDTKGNLSDYVLSRFDKDEEPVWDKTLKKAVEAMEVWVLEGIDRCMSRFNSRK